MLVVFRTGATAAHKRVPPHLDTTLSCLPKSSYVLLSDLDETLTYKGVDYHLHDVLAPHTSNSTRPLNATDVHPLIPVSRLMGDPSFELYRALRAAKADGRNLVNQSDALTSGSNVKEDGQGWKLDKWKFLPMLDFALNSVNDRPEVDWFFFVEADTYFSMRNLLLWMFPPNANDRYPANTPWYLGSPSTFGGGLNFAHGGSGFLINRVAMRKAVDVVENDPKKYEEYVDGDCCGDNTVARVLQDVGVWNTGISPVIQGETPQSLDFLSGGDGDPIWCKEATTWHHADAEIIEGLWAFEQEWWKFYPDTPFRHRDIFYHFVMPEIGHTHDAWDNDSGERVVEYSKDVAVDEIKAANGDLVFDEHAGEVAGSDLSKRGDEEGEGVQEEERQDYLERAAALSFEGCHKLCELDDGCMQFSYITGKCGTSRSIRLGTRTYGLMGAGRRSGWMVERIKSKIAGLDERCPMENRGRLAGEEKPESPR